MEQTLTHWVCACKNIGRPYDGVQEREWTVRVNVSISLFLFESYALGASLHHYLYILNPSSLNGHSMLNSNDVSSNINLHKVELRHLLRRIRRLRKYLCLYPLSRTHSTLMDTNSCSHNLIFMGEPLRQKPPRILCSFLKICYASISE